MYVRLRKTMAGAKGRWPAGSVQEVSDAEGARFVERGYAEEVSKTEGAAAMKAQAEERRKPRVVARASGARVETAEGRSAKAGPKGRPKAPKPAAADEAGGDEADG